MGNASYARPRMRTLLPPPWVELFYRAGRELPSCVVSDLRATRADAIPWLLVILRDEARLERGRPAARYAQAHAARLVAEFGKADEVLPVLIPAFVEKAGARGGVRRHVRSELHAAITSFGAAAASLALAQLERAETDDTKAALAELLVGLADVGTPPVDELISTATDTYESLEDGEAKERRLHAFACRPLGLVSDERFQLVAAAASRDPIVGAHLLARVGDERGIGILVELMGHNPSMHPIARRCVLGALDELQSRLVSHNSTSCPASSA